ncbi:LysM peptidoglycan-binding domain-containing protein [Oscillatoria amoena NRMC-F 0135]|nr:LysM peptidoglycan-binding domain-containing protein [Oscillatoria amoena NRMC-F 0135]
MSADLTTQNVIESAPTSIDNKSIADMDSAAVPTEEAGYATEIITAEAMPAAPVIPAAPTTPSTVQPAAVAPQPAAPVVETPAQMAPVATASTQAVESVVAVESTAVAEPAPVESAASYAVQKGDTLIKIARANGTTVQALKTANQLQTDNLRVGQKLVIPGKTAVAAVESVTTVESVQAAEPMPAAPKTVAMTHTVKPGETLYRIAKKHNTSVSALKSANGIKTETLKIGQKLTIPGQVREVASTPAPTAKAGAIGSGTSYTVQKGDSIYAIARKHQVSVEDIIQANQIKDVTKVGIGQKLVIPGKGNASASTPSPAPAPAAQEPSVSTENAGSVEAVAGDHGVFAPSQIEMATNTKLD